MSDLFWLTDEQMARLQPFFPLSHGRPRVDDRRDLIQTFCLRPFVRVDPGASIPSLTIRFSVSWKNTAISWRSAFASSVSWPCLYCGWFAPRLIVSGFLAP